MSDERYAYILLSDEKWWNRLCKRNQSGSETHSFVRRSRVAPLQTKKLLFYVKRPVMQIRGVADFVERLTGGYKKLWSAYGSETCLKTFREYVDFLQGRKTVTFIRLTNFRELENPIPIEVISKVLGVPRMPRGGKYLNRENTNQFSI